MSGCSLNPGFVALFYLLYDGVMNWTRFDAFDVLQICAISPAVKRVIGFIIIKTNDPDQKRFAKSIPAEDRKWYD